MGKNIVLWDEDKTRPFINPYNFVTAKHEPDRNKVKKGDLSGYITCTLRVEDMLAIPDIAQNPDSQSFDFFPAVGKPIIPGSELRGCIRSAYEALTGSCFSVVNSNVLSKRIDNPDNNTSAGLLMKKDGKWIIYEAWYKKRNGKRCKEWENGVHCKLIREWFKCADIPTIDITYFHSKFESSGADCKDEDIDKLIKIYDIYYEGIKKSEEGDAQKLRDIISDYKEKLQNIKEIDNSDIMIPVFFETDENNLTYFSPAHIGRKVFESTVPSLLGDRDFCKGIDGKYCPGCVLFGTLGNKMPLASRLRFTDAMEKKENSVIISDEYVILPEQSSPKLSTVEFYSTHGEIIKNENISVWNYDSSGVELRGRKFYFHGIPQKEKTLGPRQIETKVAQSGSLFTFKVYFDNIRKDQLQQLLWVITIGENSSDSKQMHKIGRGKPVGYGSVKITVDDISLRELDKLSFSYSIKKQQYDDYMQEFDIEKHFDMKALSDFKTITNYSLTVCEDEDGQKRESVLISYPIAEREPKDKKDKNESTENLSAGHQWFTGNRKPNSTFGRILPVLSSDINAMRLYALHGKNEITPTKNKERTSKNNKGKYKPRVFFEKEIPYAAEIVGIHEENGEKMVDVTVCGEKAKIKLRFLPKRLQNDVQKAIEEHSTISVTFQFMSKTKEPVFFVVPGQT